ncbi:TonB-dependent receptor [Anaeroselena agilis]|uniref:TonB-dependent receptor n=1 Tax=Anaeroselena agilis TaxID=3063788 RepID=A0ABU3P392_9FIRM|nr:TonB-dependent receptor [Selenomonadales bacterium 4137-cl]
MLFFTKPMQRSGQILLLSAIAFYLLNPVDVRAYAAQSPTAPEYELGTVYVTGAKEQVDIEKAQKTTVDVKDKINAGQINSVTDLFRDLPGFTVLFNPNSGTQPTLRGMGGERFLVAINGNILQNQGGLMLGRGFAWDSIPIASIQKVEVIPGASSAAYAGTWGGVVNLVTETAPGKVQSDIKYSYGSFATRKVIFTNQGASDDGKYSWLVNLNKNKSDGFYRNNWSDDKNANLNLRYKINARESLDFSMLHDIRTEGIITGNKPGSTNGYLSNYPVVNDPPTLFGTAGWPLTDGSYRFWRANNYSVSYTSGSSKLSLHQNNQFRTEWGRTALNTTLRQIWQSNLTDRGVDWQQTSTAGNHKLTYGLQYQTMNYDLTSYQSLLKTDFNGLFFQDNWQIDPKWIIGLGARYDYSKFRMDVFDATLPQKPCSSDANYFSPKLSITHNISDRETVYASAGSVFRPPTPADYFRWSYNYFNWDAGSTARQISAARGFATQAEWQQAFGTLNPEHGRSYEVGWRKQATDRLSWRVTGYYMDIDNYINIYISRFTTQGYYPTYNVANAKIRGLEMSFNYDSNPHFSTIVTASRQKGSKGGDNLDASTLLNNLPEYTFSCGFHYKNRSFRAAIDMHYTGEMTAAGRSLPGYTTTDLSFQLENKRSVFSLAICNIFDKYYFEANYPMPGRTYSLSWHYKL